MPLMKILKMEDNQSATGDDSYTITINSDTSESEEESTSVIQTFPPYVFKDINIRKNEDNRQSCLLKFPKPMFLTKAKRHRTHNNKAKTVLSACEVKANHEDTPRKVRKKTNKKDAHINPFFQMRYLCYFCNYSCMDSEYSMNSHVLKEHPSKQLFYMAQPESPTYRIMDNCPLFGQSPYWQFDGNISNATGQLVFYVVEKEKSDIPSCASNSSCFPVLDSHGLESSEKEIVLVGSSLVTESPAELDLSKSSAAPERPDDTLQEMDEQGDEAGKEFYCVLCQFSSNFHQTLESHVYENHPNCWSVFFCPEEGCTYYCLAQLHLRNHLNFVHGINKHIDFAKCTIGRNRTKLILEKVPKQERVKVSYPFECRICSFQYDSIDSVVEHITNIHLNEYFKCAFCTYLSKTEASISGHYNAIHQRGMNSIFVKNKVVKPNAHDFIIHHYSTSDLAVKIV